MTFSFTLTATIDTTTDGSTRVRLTSTSWAGYCQKDFLNLPDALEWAARYGAATWPIEAQATLRRFDAIPVPPATTPAT